MFSYAVFETNLSCSERRRELELTEELLKRELEQASTEGDEDYANELAKEYSAIKKKKS